MGAKRPNQPTLGFPQFGHFGRQIPTQAGEFLISIGQLALQVGHALFGGSEVSGELVLIGRGAAHRCQLSFEFRNPLFGSSQLGRELFSVSRTGL